MPAVVKRIAHDRFDLWIVRKVATTAAKTMTEEPDQQQAASDDMTKKDAEEEMTTACRISHLFVSALLCKLVQ